ncbi:MAG: mechanosensitive ion channel family protein [Eubacterium sp.]|nr:mechanosensitive ion channel family protein [Eubacterium sp.]
MPVNMLQTLFLTSSNTSAVTLLTLDDVKNWIRNKGSIGFDYIIKIIIAIIAFFIVKAILKRLINLIQTRMDKRGLDKMVTHFVLNLVKYVILIFTFVTIITKLHLVEAASIAALVASAGVGVSLAMQGALSNFAGGVLLLMMRPFKIGDYIVVPSSNVEGMVEAIEMYYTTIRTIANEVIKIPNSQLTNNAVTNRSGNNKRALVVKIDVAYDNDIDKAKQIFSDVISNEEMVDQNTKSIFIDEFGDSGISLGAFMMVPVSSYLAVKRSINEKLLNEYRKEGIVIPFNQLDVHIIKED